MPDAVDDISRDFSVFSLIAEADIVVKLVLIILFIASLWSWTVIIDKLFSLGATRRNARRFEDNFWAGRADSVDGAGSHKNAAARVYAAASREWSDAGSEPLTESEANAMVGRAERSMRATIDREVGRAARGTGVLAIIASSSPFIGLFGTVWGIMNAFIRIGEQQDTSLATVAGPIAEALFATGLGLVAAIPAMIFFNKFTGDVNRLADQLETFGQDVLVRLSRRATEWASTSRKGL